MGIIKTAILSGAGIYAVNKIAKSAEHRRQSPAPYYPPQQRDARSAPYQSGDEYKEERYYDDRQPQQGYQNSQGQQQQQQQYSPPAYGQAANQGYEERREYGQGSGSGMREAVMGVVGQQFGKGGEKDGKMGAVEKLFK